MNRLRLTSVLLVCGLILTACSNVENAEVTEDTSTTEETSITTVDTTTDTTDTDTTTDTDATEGSQSKTESDSEDTSSSEDEDATESTDTTEQVSDTTTSSQEPTTYDGLAIPIQSNSSYITEDMCREVSEYFDAMLQVDVDTFQSKQLSAYNTYIEEYLEENESNVQDMLSTYYSNFLNSSSNEDANYSEVVFNSISLDYPNDMDSILNTMQYIYQLDEVTAQYEDYTLSDSLTAYYQLDYSIDYTIEGGDLEDYNSIKSGSILVLDVDGDTFLLMLY